MRRYFVIVVALVAAFNAHAQQADYNRLVNKADSCYCDFDHALKARLDTILDRDQLPRQEYVAEMNKTPRDSVRIDSLVRVILRNDSVNQAEVAAILDTYGWPAKDKVGEVNVVVWAVLQHSSLETVEKHLPLLVEAAEKGELSRSLVAMMEDRCSVWKGSPQKYGTQGTKDKDGQFHVAPLLDAQKVDEWRKEVGLQPLQEYIEYMNHH